MKCQSLFSGKIRKILSVCCLLNLPREWLRLKVIIYVNNLKMLFIIIYFKKMINLYHSLGIFSRRQIDDIFLIFPQKTGFDITCKLSP